MEHPDTEGRGIGKRVLLMEDDFFVRDVYQRKLRAEGFTVDAAANGMEGLEMLKKNIPNIILLDIFMPYVDGRDVLQEIHKHEEWNRIPILLLTNLADAEGVRFGFEYGVREFLIKSHFTPTEVMQKIYTVLEEVSKDGTINTEDSITKNNSKEG